MQKVILMGYVGNIPEERYTKGGTSVTTFRLGVNGRLQGEKVTNWYSIQCWDYSFKKILSYIKKGSNVLVMGELMPPHTFEGKHGTTIALQVNCQSIDFVSRNDTQDEESVNTGDMPF